MEKPTSIHSGTPNPYVKQVPVIKFGNEHQYRKKMQHFITLVLLLKKPSICVNRNHITSSH